MSAALGDQFPLHVLREYALVADGERGALHGPHGDLVWLCAPRWHDDAVFSRLVGGGGTYAVTPAQPFVWGGSYEPGSLIWGNRWVTGDNVVTCREALAMPADPHRAVVLRQVVADQQDVRVQVTLDVRAGFGHHRMRQVRRHEDGTWTARTGDLQVRWSGARDAVLDDQGVLRLDLHVTAGQRHDLVLEISDRPLPEVPDAPAAWAATEDAWRAAPNTSRTAAPRDAAQAIAVLRGLTSTSGGMVAAATMSLPERAEQHRNYDYRYVWVRDQCYAGLAATAVGAHDLLDAAVQFVTARLLTDGDQLKPAYLANGGPVPDERTLALPGYPGGRDVVGNWVNQQFQLDALGEVLQLLSAAAAADRLDNDGHRALRLAADVIERRWQQPDAGIWELDNDWWTHSRLACVAGLRAFSRTGHAQRGAGHLTALADAILTETTRTCLHPDGYWQQTPTRTGVDAALLLPAVRGALPANDPRTRATLRAVLDQLVQDGYAYRFVPDQRPLGEAEGAFLLCGFLVSLAHHHQGDLTEAFRWFERNRAACGPPGLFSEEYDVHQRQLRGNLPQAFVHAIMLETSATLGR